MRTNSSNSERILQAKGRRTKTPSGRNSMRSGSSYLFHPLTFPALFLSGFLLYSLGLANSISKPTISTILYVWFAIALYTAGVLVGPMFARRRLKAKCTATSHKRFFSVLWVLYAVAVLCFIFEHIVFVARFGSIPVLQPNFEVLRFEFPVNGYIHTIAVMNYTILYAIILGHFCYTPNRDRPIAILLGASVLSIALDVLIGNRVSSIGFIIMVVIALSFRYRFTYSAILTGMAMLIVFGAGKLYRDYSIYGAAVFRSVRGDWVMGDGVVSSALYFLYMGIAKNFDMLNLYIQAVHSYTGGYFSLAAPLASVIPGKEYGFVEFQRDVLGIEFHGTLTGTFLTVPYVDFGYVGALFPGIMGMIAGLLYYRARGTSEPKYIALYGYYHWCMILSIYTYMFNKFYILLYFWFIYWMFTSNLFQRTRRSTPNNMRTARSGFLMADARHACNQLSAPGLPPR